MANEAIEDKKKPHREPHSGRKAEKKTTKKKKEKSAGDKHSNPKAFAFNSAVRAERRFRRTQDLETKKQHIPVVDRTPIEPPPIIVAVVGPPKVGKSTLIHCLVKNFTRQPLTSLKGPVTIVSGKKRRLTIMECNNDINSMIDIAKIADLVLLLVDASFGFEMEIFEFLNICQVHGMPRIMGVLTHLDMLKHSKQLKRVKKTLKHRFWTEVYAGAKLFYLSGLLHGEYLRNEVKNLGRFISVMKFRPLIWRTSHPYVLVDRLEDITSPEIVRQNPVVDRDVCLYGFVRGIPLSKYFSIHIPGCGDFKIKEVTYLPDPCPLPEKEKRRSLIEKEKLIYAPFSGVGGIVYDKDAVYVELGGSHSHSQETETCELVTSLKDVQEPLDKKIAQSELQLFSGAEPISCVHDFRKPHFCHEETVMESGRKRRRVVFENDKEGIDEIVHRHENGDQETDNTENSEISENEEVDSEEENESGVGGAAADDDYGDDGDEEEEEENDKEGSEVEISNFCEIIKENDTKSEKFFNNQFERKKQWKKREFVNDREEAVDSSNNMTSCLSASTYSSTTQQISVPMTNYITSQKHKNNKVNDVNKKLIMAMGDNLDEEVSDDGINLEEIGTETHQNMASKETIRLPRKQNLEVTNKILKCLAELEKKSTKDNINKEGNGAFSSDEDDESGESDDELPQNIDCRDFESDETFSGTNDKSKVVEDSAVRWKMNLAERAANAFLDRQTNRFSLWKLVYGQIDRPDKNETQNEGEDLGGLFHKVSLEQKQIQEERDLRDGNDCSKARKIRSKDWTNSEAFDSILDCFVTGKWRESEDAEELLRLDDASISDESEMYGDFEDMETGEKHTAVNQTKEIAGKKVKNITESSSFSKSELIEKKKKLKAKFDAEYDECEGGFTYYDELKQEVSRQAQLNKSEFEDMDDDLRVQLEGFRPGMYVRVEISHVPCELITNFDATYPLIIGGLLTGEENVGYVQVRIKKHRWHNRVLKNCDPLIVSLGWRRFQTIPVFAKLEDNLRHRMLKYTPEHVSCMAHFWGPITPQGTGFLAVQDVGSKESSFRIAATGSVVELDKSVQVMKKLKLTGVPMKIYKKTAFIRGMFSSALEVAKFEGAKLRTVSGLRGQIKKAVGKPEGTFRATFEDKLLFSDIVFCRTWYKMEIPRLYNPVLTLLLPPDKKNAWRGMKTVGQLKREKGIRCEPNKDSLYTPIHREPRVFNPLVIPAKLQKILPYKDKPKKNVEVSARQQVEKKRIAVVRDPYEQKVARLMRRLKASYEVKQKQEKAAVAKKKAERQKMLEKEEVKQLKHRKELRKQVFRTLNKLDQKKKAQAESRVKKKR